MREERRNEMNKQQKIERAESAKKFLKHDLEYLEKNKGSGSVQQILTTKARIRMHELTIQLNG